ncbi:hypothetical protein [Aminobacter sp. LjRoot7]|uniref:hypothetical protein n=1 Tax=Aminobacter sp. LjRoot7 TaxID=3342335 RepID=UPI003ECC9731
MVRMLAPAVALAFFSGPAEAASNKFLKWAASFDSCWMRAYDKAQEPGAPTQGKFLRNLIISERSHQVPK